MVFNKLRGRIKELGKTEADFAKDMGMSSSSLSLRLNGKIEWNLDEMKQVCTLLEISKEDVGDYFFS